MHGKCSYLVLILNNAGHLSQESELTSQLQS